MSELLTDAELTGIRARVSHQHRPGNQRPTPLATTIDLERLISHTNAQAAEIRGLRAAYDRVCIELAEITQAYVDKTTQAYDQQQELARLHAANAAAEQKTERLRKALKEIKDTQGKVCPEFDICDHAACISSYTSWTIADSALLGDDGKVSNG